MPIRKLAALLLLLGTTACERSTTGARDDAPVREAPQLAEFGDGLFASPDVAGTAGFDLNAGAGAFERTHPCPAGGNVTVTGTVDRAIDRVTHSGTLTVNARRVENACAFRQRNGVTVTITGQPHTVITVSQSFDRGVAGIRTQTQKGTFAWSRSTGRSATCTVDLTSTFDPTTHTATIKGTFCGRPIDETRTRAP